MLLLAGIGALIGARLAPNLRERVAEERMLQTVLAIVGVGALFAAFSNDLFGAAVLSFVIASGAATGKLAFDSLVQRAAPDANYGRSFARFEARFQGAWVIGAFVPAVIPLNLVVGGFGRRSGDLALVSYLIGSPPMKRCRGRRSGHCVPRGRGNNAPPAATVDDSAADPPPTTPGHAESDPAELTIEDLRPSQPEAPQARRTSLTGGATPSRSSRRSMGSKSTRLVRHLGRPSDLTTQLGRSIRASQRPGASTSLGVGRCAGSSKGAGVLRRRRVDDTAGEGRATVVLLRIELKSENSFDEPIAGIGFDPASPERLGDHPVGADQRLANRVHHPVDVAGHGGDECGELGLIASWAGERTAPRTSSGLLREFWMSASASGPAIGSNPRVGR